MIDPNETPDSFTITFLPSGREVELKAGEDLLAGALREGVPILTSCGGNARCGSCLVEVVEGAENLNKIKPDERDYLSAPGQRLACRALAYGPVTVRCIHPVPEHFIPPPIDR